MKRFASEVLALTRADFPLVEPASLFEETS